MKKDILLIPYIFIVLLCLINFDLLGLTAILTVSLFVLFLARLWPSLATILYVALFIRILAIVLSNNSITLPDSSGDAYWFEFQAYEWSKVGFPNVLYTFGGWDTTFRKDVNLQSFNSSFFVSYVIAIIYSLTDRSMMLAQSLSLLFGMLSILMSYILAAKLWDDVAAIKVGWFTALFPSLILYSSLVMREIYFCFFLLVALNFVTNWTRTGSLKSFFLVIISFMGAMLFHGGAFVGLIMFLVMVVLLNIKKILRKLFKGFITLKSIISLIFLIFFIGYYSLNNIFIPKIGTITDLDQLTKNILNKNYVTHRGSAKYPDWVIAKSETELIYKMPVRAMYLIFSPLPWEVKKTSHLLGMIDSFFYMFFVYLIFRNRKAIWEDPALRIIFFILLTYLFVYGIAIANFGTGLRHRTKFIIMFILLAAPLLPRFTFSKKKLEIK